MDFDCFGSHGVNQVFWTKQPEISDEFLNHVSKISDAAGIVGYPLLRPNLDLSSDYKDWPWLNGRDFAS